MTTTADATAPGVPMEELRAFVGRSAPGNTARDPVNVVMIRHWCDIFDEHNPVYTDPEYAARSVFGGIVAPPRCSTSGTSRVST